MLLLAVDPGESNGWCILEYDQANGIQLVNGGTTKRLAFYHQMGKLAADCAVFVVEDFKVRPDQARKGAFDWSQLGTIKVIGALECLAETTGKEMVLQQPSVKPMGYGWLGRQYRQGAKDMHHMDAAAHGVYFLVTRFRATPPHAQALKQLPGEGVVRGQPLKPGTTLTLNFGTQKKM